ncbi:MAG: preprotein translocase subunit YajC [Gaiellaceae bacterium]
MIAASSSSGFFFIIIIAFALLWLIVVRPQRKRQSQQQRIVSELQVGDEVLTAGGLYGRVTGLDEDDVRVEIAPKVEVRLARRAIAAVLTEHEAAQSAEDHPSDDADEGDEHWRSAFDEGSDEEKPG